MTTRSRAASVRRGSCGRSTRAAVPPCRAQAKTTGNVGRLDASATDGTLTEHDDTTVAVTTSGADADWAPAIAGARIKAATSDARSIYPS